MIKRALLIVIPSIMLSACAGKQKIPPCPKVKIEKTTAQMVSFGEEGGRDITDIAFSANIDTFSGECIYNDNMTVVDVTISPVFQVDLGAAAADRTVSFDFFTAIPAFYPREDGKYIFNTTVRFPEGVNTLRYRDEPVVLSIPIEEGKNAVDYKIYLGLQLSKQQLEYNRERQL